MKIWHWKQDAHHIEIGGKSAHRIEIVNLGVWHMITICLKRRVSPLFSTTVSQQFNKIIVCNWGKDTHHIETYEPLIKKIDGWDLVSTNSLTPGVNGS